jgi:hypothetical protein
MAKPSSDIQVPTFYETVAAAATLQATVRPDGSAARRLIVGSISGTIILTRPDSTTVTMSEDQINALGGVIERQFIAFQSAACTDFGVDY